MKIPAKKNGEIYFVDVEDILYISIFQKQIMLYTETDIYYHLRYISEYYELTKPFGFEMLDRNNLVQVSKIARYDPIQKIAFFGDDGKRYCTVSGSNEKFLNNLKQ